MKIILFCLICINIIFITGCRTVYYPVSRYGDKSSCSYYNLDDIKNYLDNNTHNFKDYDDYMSVNYGF